MTTSTALPPKAITLTAHDPSHLPQHIFVKTIFEGKSQIGIFSAISLNSKIFTNTATIIMIFRNVQSMSTTMRNKINQDFFKNAPVVKGAPIWATVTLPPKSRSDLENKNSLVKGDPFTFPLVKNLSFNVAREDSSEKLTDEETAFAKTAIGYAKKHFPKATEIESDLETVYDVPKD